MTEYLVELYLAEGDAGALEEGARRARQAADEESARGPAVRYVDSIYVPADETCLLLFESESAEAVSAAARRASLRVDHIGEAITLRGSSPSTGDR